MQSKNRKLLSSFINDHPLASDIFVSIEDGAKKFQPRYPDSVATYENANILSSILMGAENFVFYLERKGYKIMGRKSCVKKSKS